MPSLIEVKELTKHFDTVIALDNISFSIKKGELFGFLGPNGAGKTTTINILTGLARPDSGIIEIAGMNCSKNPKAAQHLIGIVPDESNLYPELTGYENLCFCSSLYGNKKIERQLRARELLEDFGLSQAADRKFGGYSKGMKRKLTIAAGIIHNPEILFLDEPTTGIDVASARQIRQVIAHLHNRGTTIFLTTHYIEEAERLCQWIGFIVKGKIVKIDTIEKLLQPIQKMKNMLVSVANPHNGLYNKLVSHFPQYKIRCESKGEFHIISEETINIGPLVRTIEECSGEVLEARRIRTSLEEVFVRITGIELQTMKNDKQKNGSVS